MPRDPMKPFLDYERQRECEEIGPDRPDPEDDGTCDYCGVNPKREGSKFCSRNCASAHESEDA